MPHPPIRALRTMSFGLLAFACLSQIPGTSTPIGRVMWAVVLSWVLLQTVLAVQRLESIRGGAPGIGLLVGVNLALVALLATANPWHSVFPGAAETGLVLTGTGLILANAMLPSLGRCGRVRERWVVAGGFD